MDWTTYGVGAAVAAVGAGIFGKHRLSILLLSIALALIKDDKRRADIKQAIWILRDPQSLAEVEKARISAGDDRTGVEAIPATAQPSADRALLPTSADATAVGDAEHNAPRDQATARPKATRLKVGGGHVRVRALKRRLNVPRINAPVVAR